MAIPWKLIGKYALQFAEYALAQRFTPQAVPAGGPMPVPMPAPPVVAPEPTPAPVLTREQKYRDRVDDIYVSILGRPTNTESERYEAYLLLEDGREDELRKNLNGRK